MKLLFSPASPYARKVLAVAHEVGLGGRIEIVRSAAHPVERDATMRSHNPLGQIPTLLTDAGEALYDSRVICEYLDDMAGGRMFGSGPARWRALTEQALADGLLGAALLLRYEGAVRPAELRWTGWIEGQHGKVSDALAAFERLLPDAGDRVDIGTIAIGCALGYLDFRFADLGWRATHPATASWFARFDERPSMAATRPSA